LKLVIEIELKLLYTIQKLNINCNIAFDIHRTDIIREKDMTGERESFGAS